MQITLLQLRLDMGNYNNNWCILLLVKCVYDKESLNNVMYWKYIDLAQQMLFKVRDFVMQFPLWMWGDEYMDIGRPNVTT